MTILDHVGVRVSDVARSKAFYEKALAPLGITAVMDFGVAVGFGGKDGKPDFWIGTGASPGPVGVPTHLAFVAASRNEVDAFYEAAKAAGGRDNGPPGLREMYHPTYYGAFVLDPDGHNVEAVTHKG